MFEIDIERDFSAAHQLKGYQGNCSALHGHNWTVQAVIQVSELDELGIGIDFRKLKRDLDDILEKYDHRNLSELPEFSASNPTSERLAELVYRRLAERVNDGRVKVQRVRICESPGSGATYYE